MMVSDVLGRERLDALLAEGKSKDDIRVLAREALTPLKESLGEDVFEAFKSKGVPYAKMKEYADYQVQKAKDAAKAAEEKAYQEEVSYAKDHYKKEYAGTDFKDRLDRGVGRMLTELAVVGSKVTGQKPDPHKLGFLAADDEIAGDFEKAHRTPEQQKIYEEKEKAFADANGTVDTLVAGADMLWQKVKNPSEWDGAGLIGDFINPVNLVGAGAGSLATKATVNTALKGATKVAVGAGAGAATDVGAGAAYDYTLAKAKGMSDEEAKKATILGAAANVAMGAGMGAGGSLLTGRFAKTKYAAKPLDEPVVGSDEFNLMSADEVLKEVEQNSINIPDDIKESSLLKVVTEAEDHSAKAMEIIKKIDESTPDVAEREAKVARLAPPTEFEVFVNDALNGNNVAPSAYGSRMGDKLEVTIKNAKYYTMEMVNEKLDYYGIVGEHKAVILDAFAKKDMRIYDDWYVGKIEQKGSNDVGTRTNAGNGREDPSVQTDRADSVVDGVRETTITDAGETQLPEPKPGDREDLSTPGRNTGDLDPENGVSEEFTGVEGQRAVRVDDGVVYGAGEKPVVQTQEGLDASKRQVVSDIVSRAKGRTGTSYVWGGTSLEKGADCSGFIQSLHAEKGIALPRTAWMQAKSHKGVEVSYDGLQVGDVIYFKPSKTGKKYAPVTHTGIVTGFTENGTPIMTHAKSTKSGVVTEPLSQNYKDRFYSAKRYVNGDENDVVDVRNTYDRYEDLKNDVDDDVKLLREESEDAEFRAAVKDDADLDTYAPLHNKEKYAEAYDALSVEKKQVQGTQKGLDLEGTQNPLFDVGGRSEYVVPGWAKSLVSDTVRYDDIVTSVSDALKGKHTPLSDRAVSSMLKHGVIKPSKRVSEPSVFDVVDVKTRDQLMSHRYFDDVKNIAMGSRKKEQNRPKRTTVAVLKESLEKRGLDKSDDAYKAEMQKLFRKSNDKRPEDGFHSYSDAEIKKIEAGQITPPIARKLRDDLREYAASPAWEKDRAEIDGGYRAFSDEAEILTQMKLDEALDLVQSEYFREGYNKPLSVDDMVKGVDDMVKGVDDMVKGVDDMVKGVVLMIWLKVLMIVWLMSGRRWMLG